MQSTNSEYESPYLATRHIISFPKIRNVSSEANYHIRKISEGSCDTEGWSIDAENSTRQQNSKNFD